MAHHTLKSGYKNLVERLNRFPQGAPPSAYLNKILKILFSEKEADLVSLMRIRDDLDQKALAELFYQYLNVEEDFIRELFTEGETRLGRTFVHEPVLSNENALHVLDYERASRVIEEAKHMAVGLCYCRHKRQHMAMPEE